MLSISSVTTRFGSLTALDKVSFEIKQGEFFGLLGPNGAGKSTLMSLVSGLRAPDEGTVTLLDRPISPKITESRMAIGLVPQSPALYKDLTAEQNLRIFGQVYGLRGHVLRERIDEALELAQLTDRRNDLVKTFSGGMQRRLNLVAALLHRPKLLLCDEPTVGVDPQARNAIFDSLERLNRAGMTIIYSTHYMEEAERLCSRIAIIDHGRILALGNLEELLTQLPFEDEITFPVRPETSLLVEKLVDCGEMLSNAELHRFRPRPDYPMSAFYTLTEGLGLHARLFASQRPSLENLFLHLTGRKLRE